MFNFTVLAIGQLKENHYQKMWAEYEKRLRPYARLKIIEFPAVSFAKNNQNQAKEIEGQRILDYLEKEEAHQPVYLLAERGQTFTSLKFATWLEKNESLVFVLGGTLGFSEKLYKKYPQISLSPLTFPHELARVVFIEQIYRAATILRKKEYHY